MIEGFVQGLVNFTQPSVLIFLFIGTVIATLLGAFPILGGMTGCALILPFIFGMEPVVALPFLCAIMGVTYTGGVIPTILLGIPGTGPNVATLIDGFPMAQKGEAGRAIGAGLTASMMGGIIAVPFALIMIPLLVPLVLRFRAPEMFLTIVLGLSFLAVLTRGSMIKGFISGGIGLLISFIGFQGMSGAARFTFGNVYLYDGISIIDVALALFAVPLLLDLMATGKAIASGGEASVGFSRRFREILAGARDVFRYWGLWLRSSVIGYIVGVIPGIGSETATFAAYGQAKQTSKNPDKFGTGCVEGVIAPESANNAKQAGALLTTLAFGIPGSAIMAIMLAAFLMMGIQPGPRMLVDHADLCFTLLFSVVISNIWAGIICFFGAPFLIKVTRISPVYLFCIILPLVYIGAFVWHETLIDIIIVLILSAVGVCARKFGYSPAAMLLAFVLGSLAEYYFFHALHRYGALFFLSPISIVLIFFIVAVLSQNAIGRLIRCWIRPRITRAS